MSTLSRGVIFLITIGFFLLAGPLLALNAPFNPSPFPDDVSPPIILLNDFPETIQDYIDRQVLELNPTSLPPESDLGSVQNPAMHKRHSIVDINPVLGFTRIGNLF